VKLTTDDLIGGVRGRRFCFGFAAGTAAMPPGAVKLIQDAANRIDTKRGRGGSRYWRPTEISEEMEPEFPKLTPGLSISELGARFETVQLGAVTPKNLFENLASCVDEAVYWEAPDGLDDLLREPAMHSALRRIAAHVLASPETDWWSTPMAGDQWTVEFTDTTFEPVERPPAELAHRLWIDEGRYDWGWWSKPSWAMTRSSRALPGFGPLDLTLVEDSFGWRRADACAVVVPQNARVFEIVSGSSWAELCKRYPLRRTDVSEWAISTGFTGNWVIPDWGKVARDYDAVHLTAGAYLSTAGVPIHLDAGTASIIAGWEPDVTFWMTDVEVDRLSLQRWTDDDEAWEWRLEN